MSANVIFDELPDGGFIREKQLLTTGHGPIPFSSGSLWRFVREGKFPKPVKLSGNITAWRVGDVREWLSKQGA